MNSQNINRDSSAATAYNLPTPSIYRNVVHNILMD